MPMRSPGRLLAAHKRLTAAGGVLLVLAAAGAYWVFGTGSGTAATAPSYRLVAATTGTVRQSVSTTGTIEPADQDTLSFAASGKVTSVAVAQGDTVKAGQTLATIDSAALKAALAQAQASLASDEARVASDEASSITGSQLTADQAAVTAAQGQVSSAQSALDSAVLTSPISGVVASVSMSVGDIVAGSSSGNGSSGRGSTSQSAASTSSSSDQIEVIGTQAWVVDATVDDTEVGLIKNGLQAQITTGAGTDPIYGTVSSVGVIASTSSTTPSYPVVVQVTGTPTGLHAGASATVALIYRQLANVLTVPTLAVHQSNGKAVVYEMSGGKQVAHTVTTGLASGGVVQIESGLASGDEVVVAIPQVARTGATTGGTPGGGFGGFGGGGFGGGGFGGGGGGFGGGGFGGGGFGGGGRTTTGGN